MNILAKLKESLQNQLPFVVYRKPNELVSAGFFQVNDYLHTTKDYVEEGFVFAPFDNKDSSILIPSDESVCIQEEITTEMNNNDEKIFFTDEESKEKHIKLVQKGIDSIHKNLFQKVVLARQEIIELSNFNVVETYKKMIQTYPTAMVYVWFHPKVGLWLGATPETLVKINENSFETMSLAGTKVFNGEKDVLWGEKEIEEQQLVTDYILEKLIPICGEISASKVETIRAGNLLHLKTKITGKLTTHNSQLIRYLHPTPAVCGFPKEITKNFIFTHETCNREFYTGFLGELNVNAAELFVNLRCMQIKNSKAFIYIGGGITKDSHPKKEWEETISKATVMKKVL